MVDLATPERAATASTVSEPTSPSWARRSRVAARVACLERSTRRSGVRVGALVRSVIRAGDVGGLPRVWGGGAGGGAGVPARGRPPRRSGFRVGAVVSSVIRAVYDE